MDIKNDHLEKWKPGVSRSILVLTAGIVWLAVGIMLDVVSYSWLRLENPEGAAIMAAVGVAAALVIHHFGFLRIVDRNLQRILPMEGPRCFFSFIPMRSYLLIGVMVLMGAGLRHSSLPKLYLSFVYTAIGTALILSSFRYLRVALRTRRNKR